MRWNTLAEWLRWQEELHPQRIDLRLERVRSVWQALGPPPLHGPVITVGGTNGKGSTVAYLDACARACGLQTGVYTSPHLLKYNERVRLQGRAASDEELCAAFARIDHARGDVTLSYFEFGTLAALDLFSRAQVELILLEVGLGGRLDAVNIIDADIALVTSIGRDHMEWLGEDLEQIAFEKAGIFRPERPAIIGSRKSPARLRGQAELIGARVAQLGREFDWYMEPGSAARRWSWHHADGSELADLPLPALAGRVQLDNAAAALCALHCLRADPRLTGRLTGALWEHIGGPLAVEAVRAGLRGAELPGRFQILPGTPRWILDVAHNQDAVRTLVDNLQELDPAGAVHLVFAVLADKEAEAMARILAPVVDHWYLAEVVDARALPVATLAEQVRAGARIEPLVCASLEQAFACARSCAAPADVVVVSGSFKTVEAAWRDCAGVVALPATALEASV